MYPDERIKVKQFRTTDMNTIRECLVTSSPIFKIGEDCLLPTERLEIVFELMG